MLQAGRGSSALAALLFIAGVGDGFLVLVHQAVALFKSSIWTSASVVTGLQWLGVRWATGPHEWRRLHEVLGNVPLVIALPVIGVLAALLGHDFHADTAGRWCEVCDSSRRRSETTATSS